MLNMDILCKFFNEPWKVICNNFCSPNSSLSSINIKKFIAFQKKDFTLIHVLFCLFQQNQKRNDPIPFIKVLF